MKNQTRYLGHTTVRCVVALLLKILLLRLKSKHTTVRCVIAFLPDIYLSRLEFRTYVNSDIFLKGHNKSNKISRPNHWQMYGCTFAWHFAFHTQFILSVVLEPNSFKNPKWLAWTKIEIYFFLTLQNWDSCFGCEDILILPSPLFYQIYYKSNMHKKWT